MTNFTPLGPIKIVGLIMLLKFVPLKQALVFAISYIHFLSLIEFSPCDEITSKIFFNRETVGYPCVLCAVSK